MARLKKKLLTVLSLCQGGISTWFGIEGGDGEGLLLPDGSLWIAGP